MQSHKETDPAQKGVLRSRTREHYDRSTAIAPDLCSLTGLAWVERRDSRLPEALRLLDHAVKRATQEPTIPLHEKERYLRRVYFNRACYHVAEGDATTGEQRLASYRKALEDIEASRQTAVQYQQVGVWFENMWTETLASGDLAHVVVFSGYAG